MAELGTTTDPKELVPGDAAALHAIADKLTTLAGTFADVGAALGAVRMDNWTGNASDMFWEAYAAEKPSWQLGSDAMTSVASTLSAHADTVAWAQGQAQEAIELYEQGRQATLDATAANAAKLTPEPVAAIDPGQALRQQAQETLDRAREQLKSAGAANASAIAGQGSHGVNAPAWLSGPATYVSKAGNGTITASKKFDLNAGREGRTKISSSYLDMAKNGSERWKNMDKWDWSTFRNDVLDTYTKKGFDFAADKKNAQEAAKLRGEKYRQAPPVSVKIGSVGTGDKFMVGPKVEGATQVGDVTMAGSAEAKAGAKANASLSAGLDGVKGSAAASVGATAQAQGSLVSGPAELNGKAEAFVGAEAGANLSAGPTGVTAGVDAFAGARVEGSVSADVGGVGAGLKGEAWAGIGAEANVTFGMDEAGKFRLGGEAGVGLGVGAKLGGEIVLDPAELTKTATDVANTIGSLFD
ncbi:putative T7SS-secreted protein [Actinophytocola algeriensis]|uniref:Putative T7SS secretion signal domain-containing protein n=1 Tax=Actinophytocola algeriensis TaxID=1768010 RepID=A0A7W7VFZ4_9PSEU|nr:hypothetical protein [Actinophytocola algeriensis]MBB4908803.1 hypothetical protein [Actinophytocola algeriensis]MBE1474810.1 hypothetical protein [Actinophytocola algeriensis]